MKSRSVIVIFVAFIAAMFLAGPVAAQDIVVSAADPASAAQGTTGLSVRITGKGFKRGATARFLRTGTSDPDGIVVNSTTYVSSDELIANIDVSPQTSLDKFDIEVSAAGRTGKGTEMFGVIPAGHAARDTLPALLLAGVPARWDLELTVRNFGTFHRELWGSRSDATRNDFGRRFPTSRAGGGGRFC